MHFMMCMLFVAWVAVPTPALTETPPGDRILDEIDENMSSRNRIVLSSMIVHGRRGSRTLQSRTWMEGEEKAFTEYLAPARERGTKMLKLGDMLWMYSPATDRTIHISGHMLRQSLMGSDLSYEDMMEDSRLRRHYGAGVIGEEALEGRTCWVLELTAKTGGVAYHRRRLWVDTERYVPLREELYAKSGKLIKKLDLGDVAEVQGRWFPRRMVFKDMLRSGEGTVFLVEEIRFDVDIPTHLFSKAALRK